MELAGVIKILKADIEKCAGIQGDENRSKNKYIRHKHLL